MNINKSVIIKSIVTMTLCSTVLSLCGNLWATTWVSSTHIVTPHNQRELGISVNLEQSSALCDSANLITVLFPKRSGSDSLKSGVVISRDQEFIFDGGLRSLTSQNLTVANIHPDETTDLAQMEARYICLAVNLTQYTEIYLINELGHLVYSIPLKNYCLSIKDLIIKDEQSE